MSPVELLSQASELHQHGELKLARTAATNALDSLKTSHGGTSPLLLPALTLLAEIQLDQGDVPAATVSYKSAVAIDPTGMIPESQGGGADKFLNLAQLDETGGRSSLQWYEKAVACLEREVSALDEKLSKSKDESLQVERIETGFKLAHALCAMCELWMTDLSFEDVAESECEKLITQAVMLAPDDAQTLQTLASIRLSQQRIEDAQAALERSVTLWKDLPTGHPLVPEFAARIALARTLMAAGMEDVALEVCERLVGEDDQSIEAWYLGGWCQHLMAQDNETDTGDDNEMKEDEEEEEDDDESLSAEDKKTLLLSSREWLRNCLKLCEML